MMMGLMSDVHTHRADQSGDIEALIESVNKGPCPDFLLFLGDASHRISEVDHFLRSITLNCPRCWVPGNHDIWVIDKESPDDTSDHRYRIIFPEISEGAGWHYLPGGPFVLPGFGIAVIGTLGWFSEEGYSEWFDAESSDSDKRLAKDFAVGLEKSLTMLPPEMPVIVATHHLSHQRIPSFDPLQGNLWNIHLQEFLERHKDRIILVAHGHRHMRYDPVEVDGFTFVAHPFGYPHQHGTVEDGYRIMEVPVKSVNRGRGCQEKEKEL